jgi:hypothetical protein
MEANVSSLPQKARLAVLVQLLNKFAVWLFVKRIDQIK